MPHRTLREYGRKWNFRTLSIFFINNQRKTYTRIKIYSKGRRECVWDGCTYHVSSQVNTQNCDCAQWEWNIAQDESQEWWDFGDVWCECVGNWFLQVVENQTSFLDTSNNWCKVIVQQNHVSSLFNVRTLRKEKKGRKEKCYVMCTNMAMEGKIDKMRIKYSLEGEKSREHWRVLFYVI